MAGYDLYEKNIQIITALVIEYPLFHTSSTALCMPKIDIEMDRGLLNSLLCDNIKSARVSGGLGWSGVGVSSKYI